MKEKIIETRKLKNRMQLDIYDGSRKLIGNRWLIKLIARMEISVSDVFLQNGSQSMETVNEIKNVLGEKVVFEQNRERNFIDETEKESIFKALYDNFMTNTEQYLSNDAFPKKYILKKYREQVEKDSWYH